MTQKTAIITGATRGLGRDMAINLAKDGVDIIFSYNSNEDKAKEVISEIKSIGQKSHRFSL
ncbi:SDR family NAD(P)-dependent oxidoreductase [Aquimarina aggregata]|uniref:SDR family NAD(P)-dependent oxidoreductase n=1 Tax=Aquimarina aggregata TaxID=1642818 RepID=UPI0031ECA289